jgi:hypothetical protein
VCGMHGVGKPPPPSKATGFVSVLSGSFIETTEHALRNRNTAIATRIFMGKPLLGSWDSTYYRFGQPQAVSSFGEIFSAFAARSARMAWSWRNKTQGGETAVPLTGERRIRSRHGGAGSEEALRAFFLRGIPAPRKNGEAGFSLRRHGGTENSKIF